MCKDTGRFSPLLSKDSSGLKQNKKKKPFLVEPQNVRNLSHPVRIRWIKLSNLAIFIYITGYLDVRKMSDWLVFRTFVGALVIIVAVCPLYVATVVHLIM